MVIRRGELPDLDAIKICIHDAFHSYVPRIGRRPASMDTDFNPLLREGRVWVLELEREVVGVMVLMEEPGALEVRSVAVRPSNQRRGLGKMLMAHAETVAREAGRSALRLYTNVKTPELLTYYSKLGYEEEARKQDQGFERVFMAKKLTSDGE